MKDEPLEEAGQCGVDGLDALDTLYLDAWREAPRMPFPLTKSMDSGEKVWINPATVAYFHEVSSGSATST